MSQQMNELLGIVRNLPDKAVKDGAMHELINLRPRDGALRPVGTKTIIDLAPRNVKFIHSISATVKVYIGVETPALCAYNNDYDNV